MTFKGEMYEQIIDMELLYRESLAYRDSLKAAYNNYIKTKDFKTAQHYANILDMQVNFIKNLREIADNYMKEIDKLTLLIGDIEQQIFRSKFILGLSNQQIMDKLAISQATLYRYYDNIDEQLKGCTKYENLKNALKRRKEK